MQADILAVLPPTGDVHIDDTQDQHQKLQSVTEDHNELQGDCRLCWVFTKSNFVSDVEQTSVHNIFYTQILGLEVIAVVDFSAALLCSRS